MPLIRLLAMFESSWAVWFTLMETLSPEDVLRGQCGPAHPGHRRVGGLSPRDPEPVEIGTEYDGGELDIRSVAVRVSGAGVVPIWISTVPLTWTEKMPPSRPPSSPPSTPLPNVPVIASRW